MVHETKIFNIESRKVTLVAEKHLQRSFKINKVYKLYSYLFFCILVGLMKKSKLIRLKSY